MVGEFLIFDIIVLAGAILLNWKHKLGLFGKDKRRLVFVIIIAYFITECFAMLGYARHWWDIGHDILVGISLPPIYLEATFLYIIAPIIVIAVWERCKKFNKKEK